METIPRVFFFFLTIENGIRKPRKQTRKGNSIRDIIQYVESATDLRRIASASLYREHPIDEMKDSRDCITDPVVLWTEPKTIPEFKRKRRRNSISMIGRVLESVRQ